MTGTRSTDKFESRTRINDETRRENDDDGSSRRYQSTDVELAWNVFSAFILGRSPSL